MPVVTVGVGSRFLALVVGVNDGHKVGHVAGLSVDSPSGTFCRRP